MVVVENPKLKAKLDQAVLPLVNALPTNYGPFKFYIVQDRFPNAFALPGGHVIVNTALLDMADRPEEVCGVVAHEIAHVTQKHGIRKIISEAGPYLVFKLFMSDRSGVFGVLGSGSKLLVSQSFSQEYELEADSVGWDYLVQAHIDPRGMVDMFHKLKLMQDNLGAEALSLSAFESHPQTEKRIRRLEAKWDRLKDKTDFVTLENSEWK
jgi:predicted Zn-dependent protease